MRAHVIQDGKVVNTIEVKSLTFMPNLVDASRGGQIGDLWDGSKFSEPPPKLLSRVELKAAVNQECDLRMSALVASYPAQEVATFAKQETEARAYLANNAAATPLIDALATNRGVPKAELAARIVAKADAFAVYAGRVIGYRQKLEDQIDAATEATLGTIDPLAGWPS